MSQDYIVDILRGAGAFISGEDISRKLSMSRAGIWKNIQELRRQGYDIAAVPHQGYLLKALPDKLYAREIQHGLKTRIFGRDVHHYSSIDSTMTAAFALGMDGAPEGTLVCAETQTKGKGRMGRRWVSPRGKGIYLSLILRPKMSPVDVAKLTLMTGVAVCEALAGSTQLPVAIKWPNDLLINGKKVAGFLTEMNAEMERVNFVVVGIGVNVNTSRAQLPETATSIKEESLKNFSRVDLVKGILEAMEQWYLKVQREGFNGMLARWRQLSCTLGRRVEVKEVGRTVTGEAIDINEFGGLVVRSDKGEILKHMSGDVHLIV